MILKANLKRPLDKSPKVIPNKKIPHSLRRLFFKQALPKDDNILHRVDDIFKVIVSSSCGNEVVSTQFSSLIK